MERAAELQAEARLLAEAAAQAGRLAMGFFRRDPRVWYKEDSKGSPVSEADFAVDTLLREGLTAARPDYGWLSEETADDPGRLGRRRVFVVDPIDGTRAFLAGDGAWTVSLALVEDGRPVAAALLRPTTDELYVATAGGGASVGGAALHVQDRTAPAGARATGPRKYAKQAAFANAGFEPAAFVPSLALRFALVAAGRLDVAFASERAHDWDLAAADLLVHEAGALVSDEAGRPPRYNGVDVIHPPLVAAARGMHPAMRRLLARLAADAPPADAARLLAGKGAGA